MGVGVAWSRRNTQDSAGNLEEEEEEDAKGCEVWC
jgi:hypothetical protein